VDGLDVAPGLRPTAPVGRQAVNRRAASEKGTVSVTMATRAGLIGGIADA
jgi:hypothetical protein